MVAVINIGGLVAILVGVLLLFRYGMPYRVSSPEGYFLITEERDPQEDKVDARYKALGWLGLILIVAGTSFQIIAVLMGI